MALPGSFYQIREIQSDLKGRIVRDVFGFLKKKRYKCRFRTNVVRYLAQGVARTEGDVLAIFNTAVQYFQAHSIELPSFQIICGIAEEALTKADKVLQRELDDLLTTEEALDCLLEPLENGRSLLDEFKQPDSAPSVTAMQDLLKRLRTARGYMVGQAIPESLSRRKREYFASLVTRYYASELRQFNPQWRRVLLSCYLSVRYSLLLDTAAEMLIKLWDKKRNEAERAANRQREQHELPGEHGTIYENLLTFLSKRKVPQALYTQLYNYRSAEEYGDLLNRYKERFNWTECYYQKLQNYYSAFRKFLPEWYELIPLVSTVTDNTLVNAVECLRTYAQLGEGNLPPTEAPLEILSSEWRRRAVIEHSWNKRIAAVLKIPYEMGTVEAVVKALRNNTLGIKGANRYAPITDHLLDKEEFLANFDSYLKKLDLPAEAITYYTPLKTQLTQQMKHFDKNYKHYENQIRINSNGTLSYLRGPRQTTLKNADKLASQLHDYVNPLSIMDLLLDCHSLTKYMDSFQSVTGRQHMKDEEKIRGLLATLYAYGCNCGPSQAARANNLKKQTVLYLRRHYTGVKQLAEAASILVDAYVKTPVARYLGDPGIFMTDSMRFPTLKNSLTARHHFRYGGGKSILLYQHVTSNCICLFSKALLCDVSESIHMLDGITKQQGTQQPIINICDNAGKSDLVFGLADLLNVEIWPRVRSKQNLKLHKPSEEESYKHINLAVKGPINWEHIDTGWKDMVWILASIQAGKADPSLITSRLAPGHPARKGFLELGKLVRTLYLLRYGMDMSFRKLIQAYTARRETWNSFGRSIFHGFGGQVKEKTQEGQEEIFWFLTVVQNAIVLWNAHALSSAITQAIRNGVGVKQEDLHHVLPVMLEHINFVGFFNIDLDRKPPFEENQEIIA